MMSLPSKPCGNIAGVTAIFPVPVIAAEIPTATSASQPVYAFPVHFNSVRVPPIKSAFIAAESLGLGFRYLFKAISALLA